MHREPKGPQKKVFFIVGGIATAILLCGPKSRRSFARTLPVLTLLWKEIVLPALKSVGNFLICECSVHLCAMRYRMKQAM